MISNTLGGRHWSETLYFCEPWESVTIPWSVTAILSPWNTNPTNIPNCITLILREYPNCHLYNITSGVYTSGIPT